MSKVPEWTTEYIGIQFKELGRDLKDGVDCWGLCQQVWKREFDLHVPSYVGEYETIDRRDVISTAIESGIEDEWEEVSEPKTGDGIVFQLGGTVMHIGVVLNQCKFLHVFKGINSCIADYTSTRWESRIYGFYRHTTRL